MFKINNKYESVFIEYGRDNYIKVIPFLYRIREINYLIKNNNYDLIYKKYGEHTYQNLSFERMCYEILKETNKKFLVNFMKLSIRTLKSLIFIINFSILISLSIPMYYEYRTYINEKKYSKELVLYNDMLNEYAKDINNLEIINDFDIIAKIINDMHKNTERMNPEKEIFGIPRLSLYIEKKGLCRHFADDFVYRINSINSKYNAKILYVTVKEKNESLSNYEKLFANHALVIISSTNNKKIVIDPVNKLLGTLANGKISMFNNSNMEYMIKPISNFIFDGANFIDIIESINLFENNKNFQKK